MADVKISALPLASTPLAGTEVLPIVQSATTDQVSVANLTAGRSVSAASLTLTTTPLAVGSGGTGLTSLTAGYIPFGNGTGAFSNSASLAFDGTNFTVGGNNTGAYNRVILSNLSSTGYASLSLWIGSGGVNGQSGINYAPGIYCQYGVFANDTTTPVVFWTNGSEKMRIASDGAVGIGYTTTSGIGANGLAVSGKLGVGTASPTYTVDISAVAYTPMSISTTQSSILLRLANSGGEASVGSLGNALRFTVTSSATEVARIDSAGNVIINTAAIATNATDGFLYVPTCAGTPTGTPTTYTGRAPIVVNTTNNKLYFYSGGAWRDAGP